MYPPHDLASINARHQELVAQAAHRRLVRSVRGSRSPTYFLGRPGRLYREALRRRAAARRHRRPVDNASPLTPLTPTEVSRRLDRGAMVVDVRRADVFADAHIDGSINLALDDGFAELAGTVLPPGADVIVVSDRGDEREAVRRLAEFGIVDVVGYAVELPAQRVIRHQPCHGDDGAQHRHPVPIGAAS